MNMKVCSKSWDVGVCCPVWGFVTLYCDSADHIFRLDYHHFNQSCSVCAKCNLKTVIIKTFPKYLHNSETLVRQQCIQCKKVLDFY